MFNKKPIKSVVFANGADENGNRYGSNNWKSTLDLSKIGNPEKYKVREGKNLVDIIPFNAGKNHPMVVNGQCEEGDTMYSLDYFVHKGIGPSQSDFTCLTQYGQRCPICDESKRNYEIGTDDAKKQGGALRSKRRVVYFVHDLIDGKYYYWDTGWLSFESPVNKRAAITTDSKTGAPVNPFDWECGKTNSFHGEKDKFNGHDYVKISEGTFDFVDREPLSDEVLNHSVDLSQAIIIPTVDELDAALCGKPVVSSQNTQTTSQTTTQASTPTETSVQPSFDTMQKVESAPTQVDTPQTAAPSTSPETTCPFGHKFGEADDHPECATCQVWDKCIDG